MEKVTRKSIWDTLSQISPDKFKKEKFRGVDFVSWMDCHQVMMSKFPEYEWEFLKNAEGSDIHYFADGTAEVQCRTTVGAHSIVTSLPIQYKMTAIKNPDAFSINNAKQRCRAKGLAEFGLFWNLWSKLDIEEQQNEEPPKQQEDTEEEDLFMSIDEVWEQNKDDMLQAKNKPERERQFTRFKKRVRDLTGDSMSDEEVAEWRKVYEEAIKENK